MIQTARIWREQGRRYRNEACQCKSCGHIHYPPRVVCESCGGRRMEQMLMASTGKVVSFTVTRTAPADLVAEAPYVVAVLEMDDGGRLMAQVADIDPLQVRTGMRVRLEFRKVRSRRSDGVIAYAQKAVPA